MDHDSPTAGPATSPRAAPAALVAPTPSGTPFPDRFPAPFSAPPAALDVGWREWVALPGLGLPAVKAKIDTGARTSALHGFDIVEEAGEGGEPLVAFSVQPLQRDETIVVRCRAPLVDRRRVTDSGGHAEQRWVVRTTLVLGERRKDVELTLVDRRGMLFRMLVGRTSLVPDVRVDPARSFLLGRVAARPLYADRPLP